MKTRKEYRCMKCEGENASMHGVECPTRKPQPTKQSVDGASALPWFVQPYQADHGASLAIVSGSFVVALIAPLNADDEPNMDDAKRDPHDVPNAAFIARAVNAYERHAKALARIMSINGSTGGSASLVKEFKAIAGQALDSYDVEAIAKASASDAGTTEGK